MNMYVYDGWFHPYDALMGAYEAHKTCSILYGRPWRIYNLYEYEKHIEEVLACGI